MANSHDLMFRGVLEGNKYDPAPGLSDEEIRKRAKAIREGKEDVNLTNTQVGFDGSEVNERQNWLAAKKPQVYKKMMEYPNKLARGEGIPIIQFQYDYLCNFDCEHCCIDKFYVPRSWEKALKRSR